MPFLPQISVQRIVLRPPSSLGLLAESVGGKQYLQERKTARDHVTHLNVHKCMGPDGMCLRLLPRLGQVMAAGGKQQTSHPVSKWCGPLGFSTDTDTAWCLNDISEGTECNLSEFVGSGQLGSSGLEAVLLPRDLGEIGWQKHHKSSAKANARSYLWDGRTLCNRMGWELTACEAVLQKGIGESWGTAIWAWASSVPLQQRKWPASLSCVSKSAGSRSGKWSFLSIWHLQD